MIDNADKKINCRFPIQKINITWHNQQSHTWKRLLFILIIVSFMFLQVWGLVRAVNQTNLSTTAFDCTQVTQLPQSECEALVAIYQSTDGPNWQHADYWLQNNTPCDWTGVSCQIGHVTELALHKGIYMGAPVPFMANGEIPSEIGQLTTLIKFIASGNKITQIPESIGNLQFLEVLDLSGSSLTNLPPEIGNLGSLRILYLNETNLTTLPPEIGNLSSLNELHITGTNLTSIPPEIGNLSSLAQLHISGTSLTSIPPEIGNLSILRTLVFGGQLTSLPPEIGNLSNLYYLNLSGNQLTSLPPEIGDLDHLENLYLNNNQLTSLPPEISNLTYLDYLNLSGNKFSTWPLEINNTGFLKTINLGENQLTSLPSGVIGNYSDLVTLALHGNHLTNLPSEIGNLSKLRSLYLQNNQLTSVPPEIGNLNLGYLYLNNNQLTSLPPEFWNLGNLEELDLSGNQLTSLPSEIGDLGYLRRFFLNDNQLTELPPEINNLHLSSLNVANNQISELSSIPNNSLYHFTVSHNPLREPFPDKLVEYGLITFFYGVTDLCALVERGDIEWLASIYTLRGNGLPPCTTKLTNSTATTISSFDGVVEYAFAANTFTDTVMLTYQPLVYTVPAIDPGIGGVRFSVTAVTTPTLHPAQPTKPYTITVDYGSLPIDEKTLQVAYSDGTQWITDTTHINDTQEKTVTIVINNIYAPFQDWAVLGVINQSFLPIILQ